MTKPERNPSTPEPTTTTRHTDSELQEQARQATEAELGLNHHNSSVDSSDSGRPYQHVTEPTVVSDGVTFVGEVRIAAGTEARQLHREQAAAIQEILTWVHQKRSSNGREPTKDGQP